MLEVFVNIKAGRVIPTDSTSVFFIAHVSQVNVNTIKKILQQRSKL